MAKDPKRFWDLKEMIGPDSDSYSDWEGFVDGKKIKARVIRAFHKQFGTEEHVKECYRITQQQIDFLIDIVTHFVYEERDQGDWTVPQTYIIIILEFVFTTLMNCRYYMKSVIDEESTI